MINFEQIIQRVFADLTSSVGYLVDINAQFSRGKTALHAACELEQVSTAKKLLRCGAEPRAVDDEGDSPLSAACENRNVRLVSLLLKHGADPRARGCYNPSPLELVAGHVKLTRLLLEHGAGPDAWIALIETCERRERSVDSAQNLEAIGLLLRELPPDENGRHSLLVRACEREDVPLAQLLLEWSLPDPIDPNGKPARYRRLPLYVAAKRGHQELVELLLERGANPSGAFGYRPLNAALERDALSIVELLLDWGADANDAIQSSNSLSPSGLRLLLAHGADIEYEVEKLTPLMRAVFYNQEEKVAALIEAGADIEKEYNGRTSLAQAIKYRHGTKIAKMLIERGANRYALIDGTPLAEYTIDPELLALLNPPVKRA